jgi:prepilin-type N-terminal cleavage/methylation domain-containing protein
MSCDTSCDRGTACEVFRRAREQSGFTLIEVLVVVVLLAAVLFPISNVLVSEGKQAPVDTGYAQAIGDETATLQRMMQEIRQAYAIQDTNGDPTTGQGSYIDFLIQIYNTTTRADDPWEVKYDCGQTSPTNGAYHACVRFACKALAYGQGCSLPSTFPTSSGSSSSGVVIDRVENTNGQVFTFRDQNNNPATNAQDIWTVEANVQVPANGSLSSLSYALKHSMTLDNQTTIPNLENGS